MVRAIEKPDQPELLMTQALILCGVNQSTVGEDFNRCVGLTCSIIAKIVHANLIKDVLQVGVPDRLKPRALIALGDQDR